MIVGNFNSGMVNVKQQMTEKWNTKIDKSIYALSVNSLGNTFISASQQVRIFDKTGSLIATINSSDYTIDSIDFNDENGDIYFATSRMDLGRYDSSLSLIKSQKIGTDNADLGNFKFACGYIYANVISGYIFKYTSELTKVWSYYNDNIHSAINVDINGNIYAFIRTECKMVKVNSNGGLVAKSAKLSHVNTQFLSINSKKNEIYVGGYKPYVSKLDQNLNNIVDQFITYTSQINKAESDELGNIYIGTYNSKIIKFESDLSEAWEYICTAGYCEGLFVTNVGSVFAGFTVNTIQAYIANVTQSGGSLYLSSDGGSTEHEIINIFNCGNGKYEIMVKQ